ncbi:MAG: FixH family protein [Nitrospirota bacterium]|nr:FixH family protein [Nitrospirota bacterium]
MNRLLAAVVTIVLILIILMIVIGARTFDGTVVKDPYTTALQWDHNIHEQKAAGWKVILMTPVVRSMTPEVTVHIVDRKGNDMRDAVVELFLTRPSTDNYDSLYRMVHKAAGQYVSLVRVPAAGRWTINLTVRGEGRIVSYSETMNVELTTPH